MYKGKDLFTLNAWRRLCGMEELMAIPTVDINALQASEWSDKFEELMRNRLVMGALRYGKLHAPGKPAWDRPASIQKRLQNYHETGNTEMLVDIANLAMLEFEEGVHPNKHFNAIDDGEHVTIK